MPVLIKCPDCGWTYHQGFKCQVCVQKRQDEEARAKRRANRREKQAAQSEGDHGV